MKYLSVLLTAYPDRFARLLALLSGRGYTHASLGLDDPERFYSFSFRGFSEETPEQLRRRGVTGSLCCRIPVSDTVYEQAAGMVRDFAGRRADYRYSLLGVVCCLLRLPLRRRKRYFCSQFVAELLTRSGAFPLRKAPALYLPEQLRRELFQSPGLVELVPSPI